MNNFVRIKEEEHTAAVEASASLMSPEQRQWQLAMQVARDHKRRLPEKPLPPPEGVVRLWVHGLVTSHEFDIGMIVVILINCFVSTHVEYSRPSQQGGPSIPGTAHCLPPSYDHMRSSEWLALSYSQYSQ